MGNATKAMVIGIGSEFRHDDGVGPEVIRHLADLDLPGVTLELADGEPSRLIDLWEAAEVVVLIDAVRNTPSNPGVIHHMIVDQPTGGDGPAASSHGLGLGDAADLAMALGRMPKRLVILAVEGHDFSAGCGLSPHVRGAVPSLVDHAVREVSTASG